MTARVPHPAEAILAHADIYLHSCGCPRGVCEDIPGHNPATCTRWSNPTGPAAIPDSAVLAVLELMGWPDDRGKPTEPCIPADAYWQLATEIVRTARDTTEGEPT